MVCTPETSYTWSPVWRCRGSALWKVFSSWGLDADFRVCSVTIRSLQSQSSPGAWPLLNSSQHTHFPFSFYVMISFKWETLTGMLALNCLDHGSHYNWEVNRPLSFIKCWLRVFCESYRELPFHIVNEPCASIVHNLWSFRDLWF